jgi:hypothetical protein
VQVGDFVSAANVDGKAIFSEVIYKPHKTNKDVGTFAHISTKNHDIKMTPSHILPGGVCGSALPLVYASKVILSYLCDYFMYFLWYLSDDVLM